MEEYPSTAKKFIIYGTVVTCSFCYYYYQSNPFALLGMVPIAGFVGILGGYATGCLVSKCPLPEGPNGGFAMVIPIISGFFAGTLIGFGTLFTLAKYFS